MFRFWAVSIVILPGGVVKKAKAGDVTNRTIFQCAKHTIGKIAPTVFM